MRDETGLLTVGLGGVLLFSACFYAAHKESQKREADWLEFKQAHSCVEAGYIEGDVSAVTTVSTNGEVGFGTAVTPRKTRWVCDGGLTEVYR